MSINIIIMIIIISNITIIIKKQNLNIVLVIMSLASAFRRAAELRWPATSKNCCAQSRCKMSTDKNRSS